MTDLPEVELFKSKDGLVTIRIGLVVRTMSIGDWSRLISRPEKPEYPDFATETHPQP